MHLGITGHRQPANSEQEAVLTTFLKDHRAYTVLHHGACQGIDAMAHRVALASGLTVVVHPPRSSRYMMGGLLRTEPGVRVLEPKDYRARNNDIAYVSDTLLAFPLWPETDARSDRSGTWQTVRLARRWRFVKIYVCTPAGTLVKDEDAATISWEEIPMK